MTRNFVVTITISSFFILAGCTSSSAPTDNIKEMITKLTDEMLKYASEMEFERAAELRDKIKELEKLMD